MICMDWKIANRLRKLANSYDTEFVYQQGSDYVVRHYESEQYPLHISSEECLPAIDRLAETGYFVIRAKGFNGVRIFSITPKLRHWFAFWLDAFTKKFWAGFFSGVAASMLAAFIYDLIR